MMVEQEAGVPAELGYRIPLEASSQSSPAKEILAAGPRAGGGEFWWGVQTLPSRSRLQGRGQNLVEAPANQ